MTTPGTEDEEFTELVDATFPRVDLVGKGANGVPRFLIAKADGESAGLLEPGFVRDLIAKAEPESPGRERVTMPSGVTLSGSAADIAAFIHKAAVRGAEPDDDVAKEKNDTADRKHKAATGAAMPDGSYPIASEADLGKAIHAVGRGGSSHNAIRKHIISRAKSLGASSKIPGNWNSDGSLKGDSVSKTAGPVAKDALVSDPDDGVDGMDPTVPLAAPGDDDAPGDPTDPGSPAWEAIDAATAQKWTAIACRLKNALSILADRENLEALTADPGDAENAWDLQDAMCACDFVIDTLAGFAVGEQAEADLAAEAMDGISKALAAFDPAPLDVIEGLCAVAKAGRVLSSANEAHIRDAAASLQTVLASLPQATVADEVTKQKEPAVADDQTQAPAAEAAQVAKEDATPEAQAAAAGPTDAGGTAGTGTPTDAGPQTPPAREVMKAALPVAVCLRDGTLGLVDPAAIVQQITKADADGDGKTPMQAVFDQDGQLIGIVDPAAITPVAGAGKKADDAAPEADAKPEGDGDAAAKPADGDAADLTPAPAADAGTPADEVGKEAAGGTEDVITMSRDVLKGIAQDAATAALDAQSAAHSEVIAKMAADNGELAEEVKVLKARLETVEKHPAAPKVFTNGAVPPPSQLRGQDRAAGVPTVDVAKALDRKHDLYTAATSAEQNEIAKGMQADAIGALAAVHATARR